MKSTLPVMNNIKKRFAVLKSSLTSLAEQISELAKRLNLLMLAVFQSSPECKQRSLEVQFKRSRYYQLD
ncbi:hypothetical protein G9A89_005066 [Geosiphon pyriformis]|nr:hypothetical protein G9A89_005066 [Geosiphon pyriformis]